MQRDYTRKPFSRYEKNTLTRFICVLLTVTLVLSQAGYTQIYADISSNDSAGYTQEVSESDPENVTDSTEYSADTDASGNTSAADTDASVDTTIKVKSSYSFSEDDLYTTVSLKSSNKSIRVSWSLEKNVFSFSFYGSGSTKLTITLNGKKFTIAVTLKSIYASTDAVLLYPGKTKKKVKAIQKAIKIYKNSTYSQAKRMKSGYYDCSSLVWRSFKTYGYYFGSKKTAPTAANIAYYLNRKGKLKGSYTYKKTQKMVMQAGDLLFKTGANNGRYRSIYHVEIFSGYALAYYNSQGEPVVTTIWVTRADGYADSGDLYARF